jgi:uncharacterized protein with PIN domain
MRAGEKIRFDKSQDEARRMSCSSCDANIERLPESAAIKDSSPEDTRTDSTPALAEGEDYYWEGSALVFTAAYLRRRGFCCESGCRHCPYN